MNESEDGKITYYWPYCKDCHQPFEFEQNEPFASCDCGNTEWGFPRPAKWIPKPVRNQ